MEKREQAIRAEARRILGELHQRGHTIWDRPPDLLDVLDPAIAARELFGVTIREVAKLPDWRCSAGPEGAVGFLDRQHREILVATAGYSEGSRRFTAAHELGHLVLHAGTGERYRNPPGTRGYPLRASTDADTHGSQGRNREEEREAHIFASEFLMPKNLLRRKFRHHFGCERFEASWSLAELASRIRLANNIKVQAHGLRGLDMRALSYLAARALPVEGGARPLSLSQIFRVSIEAMAIQLEDVGLVTMPQDLAYGAEGGDLSEPTVFFCYNSGDQEIVEQIADKLKIRGVEPWLDKLDLRPGSDWIDEIQKLIRDVGAIVVFIGRDGIGPWQDMEIKAIVREAIDRGCRVIPALLPRLHVDPELPIFLRGFQAVDFRLLDPDPVERLIWGITDTRELQRPGKA